jgi:hypothetical protein
MRKLIFLLSSLLVVWSCDTREVDLSPEKLGHIYFPLQTGHYAIYEIEQTTYSLTAPPAVIRYQLKEVIADTFTDLTGDKVYRLHRFIRKNSQLAWPAEPDSVWTAKIKDNRAIRTENNAAYIKLAFPVKEKLAWNGNALNNCGESATLCRDEYQIQDIGKPFQVLGRTFDRTLTVIQHKDSNLVSNDRRIEIFAPEAGLIQKERYWVQYCGANQGAICRSAGQIDFGVWYIQRLSEYGME